MKKLIFISLFLLGNLPVLLSQELYIVGTVNSKDKDEYKDIISLTFDKLKCKQIDLHHYCENSAITGDGVITKQEYKSNDWSNFTKWFASVSKKKSCSVSGEDIINNIISDIEKAPASIILISSVNINKSLINKNSSKDSIVFFSDYELLLSNAMISGNRGKYFLIFTADKKPYIELQLPKCNNSFVDCYIGGTPYLTFMWKNTGSKKVVFNLRDSTKKVNIIKALELSDDKYFVTGNNCCYHLPFFELENLIKPQYNFNNFKRYPYPFYWSISYEWNGKLETTKECLVRAVCITSNVENSQCDCNINP
jgi:hypothetical protein